MNEWNNSGVAIRGRGIALSSEEETLVSSDSEVLKKFMSPPARINNSFCKAKFAVARILISRSVGLYLLLSSVIFSSISSFFLLVLLCHLSYPCPSSSGPSSLLWVSSPLWVCSSSLRFSSCHLWACPCLPRQSESTVLG